MQYKHVVRSVQCSMCNMKCTCSYAGAIAVAGAVTLGSMQGAVCYLLKMKIYQLKVKE